jgi:hypothetical protein
MIMKQKHIRKGSARNVNKSTLLLQGMGKCEIHIVGGKNS